MLQEIIQGCSTMKGLITNGNYSKALEILNKLKASMIDLESLPPLGIDTEFATEERAVAREILEYAVILSVKMKDKESFQRNISSLRPYYSGYSPLVSESKLKYLLLGLNLLFLLVENRLSDFHCELELLSLEEQLQPSVLYCTQLDQHLMVGSYDQVMTAARNPPDELYTYFLSSLFETVRSSVAECASVSYPSLTVKAFQDILMLPSLEETTSFLTSHFPTWIIKNDAIEFEKPKSLKSDGISSGRIILQTLAYATELERIV